MTIIESYSVGTPVIGARIGGIPEIVIDRKTGYTFEHGNYIDLINKVKLVSDIPSTEYGVLSQNVLSFAEEHFSKDRYYNKLVHFYNSLLSNNENRCNRN